MPHRARARHCSVSYISGLSRQLQVRPLYLSAVRMVCWRVGQREHAFKACARLSTLHLTAECTTTKLVKHPLFRRSASPSFFEPCASSSILINCGPSFNTIPAEVVSVLRSRQEHTYVSASRIVVRLSVMRENFMMCELHADCSRFEAPSLNGLVHLAYRVAARFALCTVMMMRIEQIVF